MHDSGGAEAYRVDRECDGAGRDVHLISLSTASIASKAADDSGLRAGVEEICAQLCAVVAGDFGSRIETASEDETVQTLAKLTNSVLAVARSAIQQAEAKASALSDAHRIARLGTWHRDFRTGTLLVSEDLDRLLGIDSFSAEKLLAIVHPDDRAGLQAGLTRAATGQPGESEFRLLRPDGTIAWFWAQTRAETDAEGKVVAIRGVTQDITERHATAKRMYELAHYDALTGLANRTLLHERLSHAVACASRDESAVAVLLP